MKALTRRLLIALGPIALGAAAAYPLSLALSVGGDVKFGDARLDRIEDRLDRLENTTAPPAAAHGIPQRVEHGSVGPLAPVETPRVRGLPEVGEGVHPAPLTDPKLAEKEA